MMRDYLHRLGIERWTLRPDFFVMPISGFLYHVCSQKNILFVADVDSHSDEEQKLMHAIACACGKGVSGCFHQSMPEQLNLQGVDSVVFLGNKLSSYYIPQLKDSVAYVETHGLKEMLIDPSLKKVVWHTIRSL